MKKYYWFLNVHAKGNIEQIGKLNRDLEGIINGKYAEMIISIKQGFDKFEK